MAWLLWLIVIVLSLLAAGVFMYNRSLLLLERTSQFFRNAEYTPATLDECPRGVQSWFENRIQELRSLGFTTLGGFVNKASLQKKWPNYFFVLVSEDRKTVADIGYCVLPRQVTPFLLSLPFPHLTGLLGKGVGFITAFTNGARLATSSELPSVTQEAKPPGYFDVTMPPSTPLAEVFSAHQTEAKRIGEKEKLRAEEFGTLEDYLQYCQMSSQKLARFTAGLLEEARSSFVDMDSP